MSGTIDPNPGERIYLDTNVFIEAVEGRGSLSELVVRLLLAVDNPERPRLVTSHLTLAELLVKPIEMKRDDLIRVYDNWMISNAYLQVVPVVGDVLRDAAQLRAQDKTLKLPDAIHLTTARGMHCRYFLTKDKRIKGRYGVEILLLSEQNLEMLLKDITNA